MKDKLTQETDETSYLLSSEKNAERIKESIAQLEQGVHIDEDGDLAVGSEKVGVASAKEKFTPGEWINNAEECRSSICVDGANFEIVSVFVSEETREQDIANAHLIAAAPKMYRMLETLLGRYPNSPHIQDPIIKLLAEARGENKDTD